MFILRKVFLLYIGLTSFFYAHSMEDSELSEMNPIVEDAKELVAQNQIVPKVIAIAGCTGVGKSYYAAQLADLLKKEGVGVAVLRLDDFMFPDHVDPHNFHPALKHALVHSVMKKIKDGEKCIRKPGWNNDVTPPSKTEEVLSLKGVQLILFEGEYILCDNEDYNFKQYSEFGIFIDADDEDIVEWDWKRARHIPKETKEDDFKAQGKRGLQKYRKDVSSSPSSARYLLLKDKNHQYTLQKQNIVT